MKTEVLGVRFDKVTPEEAVQKALSFLNENKPHTIYTPNPEFLMTARKNEAFKDVLNRGDLVIPDGIGVVYMSKLNKVKLAQRVTGYDTILSIFKHIHKTEKTVYFLGGAPGVAELAKENLLKQYEGLSIVGTHDGYFDEKEEQKIFDDISAKKPDILVVGLGFPRQEMWFDKNKNRLPVKIFIGCGGALDGFSGKVQRAPVFYQKHGLEWFYRLVKQPERLKRQLVLPLFVLVVIKEKINGIWSGKKK